MNLTLFSWFSFVFFPAEAESLAWLHLWAPCPLWESKEREWCPAGQKIPEQQGDHGGAARRAKGGGQILGHHTLSGGLRDQVMIIEICSMLLKAAFVRQLWCTSSFSQGLADNAVISRVNGELWDLDRPLQQDCSLELLRFDNEDAQAVSTLCV